MTVDQLDTHKIDHEGEPIRRVLRRAGVQIPAGTTERVVERLF